MALYKGHSVTNVSPQSVKRRAAMRLKDVVALRWTKFVFEDDIRTARRKLAHLCVNILAALLTLNRHSPSHTHWRQVANPAARERPINVCFQNKSGHQD
jgi:hypothetical protein